MEKPPVGIETRIVNKNSRNYPNVSLYTIFKAAKFNIGDSVMVTWKEKEIKISEFKYENETG